MLQLSEFVWTMRSSVWVVFNNFLLIDATDRSKISSDQKRLFFAVSLYPLSFFANTPFKETVGNLVSKDYVSEIDIKNVQVSWQWIDNSPLSFIRLNLYNTHLYIFSW